MGKSGISILLNAFSFNLESAAVVMGNQKAWLVAFRGKDLVIDKCFDNVEEAKKAFNENVLNAKLTPHFIDNRGAFPANISKSTAECHANGPVLPKWTPLVHSRKSFEKLKKLDL